MQYCGAALQHIPPGGREIPGIPRVGHIARAGGVVEQAMDFSLRVTAADAQHIADVGTVHADEQVVAVIVCPGQLTRRMPSAGDAVGRKFPPRRRIDRVADLLGAGRSRVNNKLLPCPGLRRKVGLLQLDK